MASGIAHRLVMANMARICMIEIVIFFILALKK
jgi:hypothetical protein